MMLTIQWLPTSTQKYVTCRLAVLMINLNARDISSGYEYTIIYAWAGA